MSDISDRRQELLRHLQVHALRTDGPFQLRSGAVASWYLDARQTTFDGNGARIVGEAVLEVLDDRVEAVGGMTMGADPIGIATAIAGEVIGRPLRAFSIRKAAKAHGTGGRLVGPVRAGDHVAVLEDTTTTGGALWEAIEVAVASGLEVVQVISLVDRSGEVVHRRLEEVGIPYTALITPEVLGVEE